MIFPSTVLLSFFTETSQTLNEIHDLSSLTDAENDAKIKTLNDHRQLLLRTQLEILQKLVDNYNKNSTKTEISIEEAQLALKQLGADNVDENYDNVEELKEAMSNMNSTARIAVTRLALKEEFMLNDNENLQRRFDLKQVEDGEAMSTSDINDFCALCMTAVSLPEVERYIEIGELPYANKDDKYEETGNEKDSLLKVTSTADLDNERNPLKIEDRLINLQNLLYRAVGYEPSFGTAEMRNVLTSTPSSPEELKVHETLQKYISTMKNAFDNAIPNNGMLSDEKQGGHTRVVSVKVSELDLDPNSGSFTSAIASKMEEHEETKQRQELEVARQAASLQQGILGELLSMDETEREETLAQAKVTHDSFMSSALNLPAGPERIQFLRTIDDAKQRLLVMHKLWQKLLEDHDGKPPQIRKNEVQ